MDDCDNFKNRINTDQPNESSLNALQNLFSCIGIGNRQHGKNIREIIRKRAEEQNYSTGSSVVEINTWNSIIKTNNFSKNFKFFSYKFYSETTNTIRTPIKPNLIKYATNADMLIAFATTPNYVSWRNNINGTWFIQTICQIFSEYAAIEDIITMLTRVIY